MKAKRRLSRYALARRLQYLALQISSGRTLRIGPTSVNIPEQVFIEEEIETSGREIEIEFEIHWPLPPNRVLASKTEHAPMPRRKTRR